MVNLNSILLATALPLLASAGCYSGGTKWGDTGNADYHINRACNGYYEGNNRIKGAFEWLYFKSKNDSPYPATLCINGPNNVKFDFWITNDNPTNGAYISTTACYNWMKNEIYGCEHGGESRYDWWIMKADPNEGRC